ncbi:ABC transporter substrate-binding protein [Bradyrhizobium sp. CCGUVB1N3]|uniref:ABC transporter substrate-binding protein n=1 Tax=Bradyrhizobium sp. CCGUVB1N3 TaxID=2949629 RepID=UPI0020B251A0|nr:ABC transporter substrate-binding protein [Bradyrhizobium sp. CCGUVB1N3]MCP3472153.1 ABC transporter substrate-binding protein [Bradyrhizobium sp. CCGUVB1N3]
MGIAIVAGLTWDHLRSPIASGGARSVASSSGSYVLQLNGPVSPASGGAIVAIADHLFEREGLSVRLMPGTSDADATSAVAGDPHAIGVASAQGFLKARAEGLPVVAFASSYVASSVEFYALSSVRLLEPADLEGKRIGYRPGLEPSTVLSAFIAKNFIRQSGLKIIESDGAVSDLLSGKLDILVGRRDVEGVTLEGSGAPYRSLSPGAFGVHVMGPVFFASKEALASTATLERFLIAIANGWVSAYSDPHRTGPIILRAVNQGLDADQLDRFMDAQRRFLRPSGARFGELDPRRLKDLQEQLLRQRIIQQPTDLANAVNLGIQAEVYRTKSEPLSPIDR